EIATVVANTHHHENSMLFRIRYRIGKFRRVRAISPGADDDLRPVVGRPVNAIGTTSDRGELIAILITVAIANDQERRARHHPMSITTNDSRHMRAVVI